MGGYLHFFSPVAGEGGGIPPGATLVYSQDTPITTDVSNFFSDVLYETNGKQVYTFTPEDVTFFIFVGDSNELTGTFSFANLFNLQFFVIADQPITDLGITNHPDLSGDSACNNSLITSLDFTNTPNFGTVDVRTNLQLTEINLSDSGIKGIIASSTGIASLVLSQFIGSVDVNGVSSLISVRANANTTPFTDPFQDYSGTALPATALDQLLSDLVSNETTTGISNMSVLGGVTPTGGVLNTDYLTLTTTRMWDITLN